MADSNTRQDQTNEDAAAKAAAAQAAADEKARVEAEEKAKADAAAAEAAQRKADEDAAAAAAAQAENDAQEETTVSVVLDPEWAEAVSDETPVTVATVSTANGEYELSSTPVDVPKSDAENVLASPAAKEVE